MVLAAVKVELEHAEEDTAAVRRDEDLVMGASLSRSSREEGGKDEERRRFIMQH